MTLPPHSQSYITVSIVSHGQLELIAPLLSQLDQFCHESISKVMLTLNIDETDPVPQGPFRFPITVVRNTRPKGFGANHNQAFKACTSPWFLILNPDIRLDSDVLAPLLRSAQPDAGILAPRIIEPGKGAPEPHRALLTPHEILVRRRPGYQPPSVPAWIPGLFMLARAEAFARVQGFDERFFMYGEDFDICARIRLADWQLQIVETLRAVHDAQRASHASLRPLAWHIASLLRIWTSSAFWRYRALLRR